MIRPVASAAVLVGGDSRRMGQDKRTLTVGGRPLLDVICDRLAPLVAEIMLVTRPDHRDPITASAPPGCRVVCDEIDGRGPLVGIHAALTYGVHDSVLVVACDMPHLQPALLAAQLADKRGDVVIPRCTAGWEPLHAVYRRACLPAITKTLAAGPGPVWGFFDQVSVTVWDEEQLRRYDPHLRSLINLNRPEDLERL